MTAAEFAILESNNWPIGFIVAAMIVSVLAYSIRNRK